MSIIIKGMTAPKNCDECIFSEGAAYIRECVFMPHVPSLYIAFNEALINKTKAEWCPVDDVPPHGRLIDENDIIRRIVNMTQANPSNAMPLTWKAVIESPTIIEAEEADHEQ